MTHTNQIKPSIEPLPCPVFWKRNFDSLQKFRRKRDRRTVVSREEEFPTSSQEMSSHCHWTERTVVEVLHEVDNRASSTWPSRLQFSRALQVEAESRETTIFHDQTPYEPCFTDILLSHLYGLLITDSLLCSWGEKALTLSLNVTGLLRTLSMPPSGVWLYLLLFTIFFPANQHATNLLVIVKGPFEKNPSRFLIGGISEVWFWCERQMKTRLLLSQLYCVVCKRADCGNCWAQKTLEQRTCYNI